MPPFFLVGAKQRKFGKIPQLVSHRKQVGWSETAENQVDAPSRKNCTKSGLE